MAKGYILMLEGDEQDRELSKYYFNSHDIKFDFIRFSYEFIPFLKHKAQEGNLPSVILLSMYSTPDTGLEILRELKAINEFKAIPVVVLGENTEIELIRECYALGASTFINKPLTAHSTDLTVKTFLRYWFEVAEFPFTQKTGRKVTVNI